MNEKIIYGIQQIGVGVNDAEKLFKWYATKLGADIKVFDDNNTATHMAKYMGGKPHDKRAILALNLQGGSGYEIWQFEDREPQAPASPIQLGDTGIFSIKVKTRNVQEAFSNLKVKGVEPISKIVTAPDGIQSFFIKDPCDNIIQIKSFDNWFAQKKNMGGFFGCTIGVSDIEAAKKLYSDVLGYDEIIYDKTGRFDDFSDLPSGDETFRRVLLSKKAKSGGFSNLFGTSQIELVQSISRTPNKIFANRYWGDIGFIHLCFDVRNIGAVVKDCKAAGFPFQVLVDDEFDMGDANGNWGYLEDPDGTLIEFVETLKVPLIKKIGWTINMKKRNPTKPLPDWLIKAMSFNRVKF
jgi:catechol 2,3-dioxygenase-like lactoylglutathione lyase family enzyme